MADIMHKTKETNTFRFKSFTERVGEIDIRRLALYHIGHENEELPEDNETYFHQTLKKWMVLNLTDEYNSFSRRCIKIVTLPQLIHKREFVVDLLLERLSTATNLSLQPLLELLYVLARDLREEFYPDFQRVLDRLICLLNTKDAEQLEWTLVCLAYLFKTLKPHLKKNIGVVFHAILPLLDEQRFEEHVTNFAVECFSFIARDVRDYRKFLDFILDTVASEQVESVQGCGRLCFELLRGVKGQFHSTAGEFLQFVCECLVDEQRKHSEKSQLLCDIVRNAVDELLGFIHPQNMQLFWTQLCAVATTTKALSSGKIQQLIAVFLQAAQYRDGRYLAELDVVVPTILKMCDACAQQPVQQEALQLLAQLVSSILLSGSTQLTQLDTSRLLKKLLTCKQRHIYDEFILSIVAHAQFEILVLPAVINYFELHLDLQAYELLASIVLQKQPLALHATGLQRWQAFPLQLKQPQTLQQLVGKLRQFDATSEEHLLLLLLAPHLNGLSKTTLKAPLKAATLKLLADLSSNTCNLHKTLGTLALLLETQIHLQLKFDAAFTTQAVAALLPHANNLRALGALDQLLAQQSSAAEQLCESVTAQLASLLSSNEPQLRLIAAHCLQTQHGGGKERSPNMPYHIFYAAASVEPNVHNYREQLLLLQQLHTAGDFYKSLPSEACKLHVLRFLLGMLYQNFKYVWQPLQQLVEEYAKVLDKEQFWQIFHQQLQQTAQGIVAAGKEQDEPVAADFYWQSAALQQLLPATVATPLTQQQLMNYRNLLWQRLPQFGNLAEVKNRELVTLFLQFVQDEYRQQLETREYTLNLRAPHSKQDLELAVAEAEVDAAVEEQEQHATRHSHKAKHNQSKTHSSGIKQILATLQCQLGVFVAQANPKALHREPELYSFYMELLAGPNPQLQKLALDCVYAYKHKALLPYKEQLYAISDEAKFKDALLDFKLAELSAEQRAQLTPILLRVLYGKMLTRGTQRQLSAQARKALILRFLAQCSSDEIAWFLQMAFGRYALYTDVALPLEQLPELVAQHFQLEAVSAPKKLQSVLNLLELIRKEFGGMLAPPYQLYMLKLLAYVGATCNELLTAAASIQLHPKLPGIYKQLRSSALLSVCNFYVHLEQFPWQAAQFECLTAIFVWPAIAGLPQECIHTPTPLLKLLLQWGERPQHLQYLQQLEPQSGRSIFHYIIELLLAEKAKPAVRKPILLLIERLLVIAAGTNNEDASVSHALQLLRPHVSQLLQRLKLNFNTRAAKQALDKHDLNILSLLTAHVESAAECDSLLQLLLPILIAKSQGNSSEEVVCQVITTLSNLIKRLPEPEEYLLKLAPLFEQVQEVSARKLLCQLVTDIAKQRHQQTKGNSSTTDAELCTRLRQTARLVYMLNAWDKRWVEQPDYEQRVSALQQAQKLLAAGSVDLQLGVLIIYNCFYFLRYDKDIGLRDNASELLQLLLPQLTRQCSADQQQLDYLVGDVCINLLRRVISRETTHEQARNEGIRLLGVMARQCPEAHEVLRDLHALGDSQDAEVDFFENMVHLQSHRHGRALLKFNSQAETLTQAPSARTLTQFVLPLATRYLLQEKYAGKHTLIDAAIETVGVACQLLPWQHYHAVLRYYLMRLRSAHDYQKQCVRIVVRILDAFHFDLTQAPADAETLQKLKSELTAKTTIQSTQPTASTSKPTEEKQAAEELETADVKLEPTLDTVLSAETEEQDEEEVEEAAAQANVKLAPILQQSQLLQPNAAKRVLCIISTVLIPTLNRAITEKSSYDNKHKVNRKRLSVEREEEEILRVPIALALIKLMQKLPKELLDTGVPGVFMKVCTFLRSPLKSVRMLTRDILRKIMLTLGASYLPMLMDYLQSLLTRGFQVHVLAVTVHGVLDVLRNHLQPADLASCLGNLLDVALNDIFGELNVQKHIDKFTAHTPEAKPSAKSYLVLHIAARNIAESCLLDLLLPFKEHLSQAHSRKLTLKIQECFGKIVAGLVENPHITRESLLIFIYGTMSESISDLLPGAQKRALTLQEQERMRRARPDCLLIQAAPPRMRSANVHKAVKSNVQANAHLLVELGLELLHIVLKRKKLVGGNYEYQPFLNPVLPLLRDALQSTHARVTTFALKCFASLWNEEYALPELQQYLDAVVQRMFDILKNFSTFGGGVRKQEDNMQLMKSVYKAIVALLRKCDDYQPTEEQIDQLVLQVEQQLQEGENPTTSFALLKAMLARKVDTPAIHDVLKRISDLSIVSHSDFVRDESRAILLTYLMEYTLKKRVDQIIKFFTVQLSYEQPSGRQSVIKLLHLICKKFPTSMLAKRAELLYLSLGTRLVNDEDSDCRKAVAECLELLITRLEKPERQRLFDMTLLFFEFELKPAVREMAAALCSRFLNAEKQSFAPRLQQLLPTIVARITCGKPNAPGRFVRAPGALDSTVGAEDLQPRRKKFAYLKDDNTPSLSVDLPLSEESTEQAVARQQRAVDHELIQMQYCLLKMFEYCAQDLFASDALSGTLDELAYESQKLLAHEHSWVRCNAAKILAHIMASYDFALVGRKLCQLKLETEQKPFENGDFNTTKLDFIYLNPAYDIKSLVLDLCAQMVPGETPQPMIDEIVKIFLFVANMLRDVPFKVKLEQVAVQQEEEGGQTNGFDDSTKPSKINLNWLIRNIRFLINKELAQATHCISMRSALFTLIEGLITLFSVETLEQLAPALLASLVREMSEEDQNIDAELRQQALRVGSRLRKRIGSELYDKMRTGIQTKLMMRRAVRKKLIAQEKIHDPVRAAKRRVGIQERKKASKKRKVEVIRGKAEDVKQKLRKKRKRKAEEDFF